jgi:DNA replication protein
MSSKIFSGFPEKPEVTPIPTVFFSLLMPQIEDIAELKTILHIFRLLSRRRGYPRFVTLAELFNDNSLREGIAGKNVESFNVVLKSALDLAVHHNILLHLSLQSGDNYQDIYFINAESDRKAAEKIQRGDIVLPGLTSLRQVETQAVNRPDIFSLYEQNIGILTPIISEELQEAEDIYPPEWIKDAFKEAVTLNKRNWRYILRILQRWTVEGKDDGKTGRNIKKENDPDRYIKGKYGHMVKR